MKAFTFRPQGRVQEEQRPGRAGPLWAEASGAGSVPGQAEVIDTSACLPGISKWHGVKGKRLWSSLCFQQNNLLDGNCDRSGFL